LPLTGGGARGWPASGPPESLVVGSLHCHSTLSDGTASPEEILVKAARAGLDFVAITDHVPVERRSSEAAATSRACRGAAPTRPLGDVLRLPAVEVSPPRNHYLILGLDPWELPDVTRLPGWPAPSSYVGLEATAAGVLGFLAHPDDPGNSFFGLPSYSWEDWGVSGYAGMEVWSLAAELSRCIRNYRDLLRALAGGLYRVVPPPNPVTLARWDALARWRKVVGVAGTDAHAHRARWHGLPVTVIPYEAAFRSLGVGVWVPGDAWVRSGAAPDRVRLLLEALGSGRSLMVNRAWGDPAGFVFRAVPVDGTDPAYVSGDTVPAGRPVRFEVTVPQPAWLRLLLNGRPVANTYGRSLTFEPLAGGHERAGGGVQEAWRTEAWVECGYGSAPRRGFALWILSNFIYRALPAGQSGAGITSGPA